MTVLLGANGKLYGAYDDVLVEFGDSIRAALDAIILERPTREIPIR